MNNEWISTAHSESAEITVALNEGVLMKVDLSLENVSNIQIWIPNNGQFTLQYEVWKFSVLIYDQNVINLNIYQFQYL